MKTFVYEKKNDEGVRHLYGNTTSSIPTASDVQLTYKDADGDVLTLVDGDAYVDDGKGGIIRKSDDKPVNVFVGDVQIIGQPVSAKVLSSISVTTKPALIYNVGETFDLSAMKVQATFESGDKEFVTGYTTSPFAADYQFVAADAGNKEITVSYTFNEVTKTDSFTITVEQPVAEEEPEEDDE